MPLQWLWPNGNGGFGLPLYIKIKDDVHEPEGKKVEDKENVDPLSANVSTNQASFVEGIGVMRVADERNGIRRASRRVKQRYNARFQVKKSIANVK